MMDGFQELLSLIRECPHCTSIVGDEGAIVLANCLSTKLKELVLCANDISDAGILTLAKSFKDLISLKTLDLSVNHIGDSGVTAVGENIEQCTALETLNLSFNHISNTGATAVAAKLRKLMHLNELDLRFNQIGDKGAEVVAKAVRKSSLQLWNPKITDKGATRVLHLNPNASINVHSLTLAKQEHSSAAFSILAHNATSLSQIDEVTSTTPEKLCPSLYALYLHIGAEDVENFVSFWLTSIICFL